MLETALKIGRLVAFSLALIAAGGVAALESAANADQLATAASAIVAAEEA